MTTTRHGQGRQGQGRQGPNSSRRGRRNFFTNGGNPNASAGASAVPSAAPGPDTIMTDMANTTGLPRVATPPLTEAVPDDTPTFADLAEQNIVDPVLVQTIIRDLKFNHMMPVQAATLHELLPPKRSDCLVQAKTGTGKTIAFLLPAIQTMINKNRGRAGISLLVISPTRELAMQIAKEAEKLLQNITKYRVCIAIGGTNKNTEEKRILQGCDLLIATPGRLLDHMSNPAIRNAFRQLDTLVLDEADRLLDMGFLDALKDIVRCLPDKAQTNRQGMLFSATIAPHVEGVAELVLSRGYKFISTIPAGEINTHQSVPQDLIKVPTFASVVPAIVGSIREQAASVGAQDFKAIVFATTAALADFYGHILSGVAGIPTVSVLHSRKSQSTRTRITDEFRHARNGILVATDVIARGMDFPNVTTVYQVGIPSDKESYIHRLGRTARAGAEGRGILIISEPEAFFPNHILKEIPFVPCPADISSSAEVAAVADQMEDSMRSKAYQAWLGYYKTFLKPLRWDNTELVAQANIFAREALGAVETPGMTKRIIGKMGLRGTRGLVIVPEEPKPNYARGAARGGGEGRSAGAGGRGPRGGGGNSSGQGGRSGQGSRSGQGRMF